MTLRKPVTAESFQLPEHTLGKFFGVAARGHAIDQLFFELAHQAACFKRCHATAQLISFVWRKSCCVYRYLHRLFLEQWHTQRPLEYAADLQRRIVDRLQPVPSPQ